MAFNAQQFIQSARQKGVPDQEIYKYLQNKGLLAQQTTPEPEKKASGGLLGYVAPALATLPQAVGLGVGASQNTKTIEELQKTSAAQSDLFFNLTKQLRDEKDAKKKATLLESRNKVHADIKQISSLMDELASGKGLEEATAIKLGGGMIADIPGLSTDPTRATQQISGRSIAQVGASAAPILGATGAGAVIGAGRGLEAGKSPLGIAGEAVTTALGFKLFGYGADKLLKTQVGQQIANSPVGNTVLKVGDKLFSPFLAKSAPAGTFSAEVDTVFKNFGGVMDKMYTPSTYLKPTKQALTAVGEKVGLVGTPEQRLASSQAKIAKYWENTKSRYQAAVKYDKNSPEILGREGIIPQAQGDSMLTGIQADAIKFKASSEHALLNRVLEESKMYASVGEYRSDVIKSINGSFKGIERQEALRAFEKQFNALLKDYGTDVISGVGGDKRIPIRLLNDMKSYMWSQGYSGKLAPKSEKLTAETMRISGNRARRYIENLAKREGADLAETIIGLNKHSGELFQAEVFLRAMNGKKLPYSLIGRHFARLTGAIVGAPFGSIGSVVGSLTGDQVVNILQNPNVSVGRAAQLIAELNKTNPKAVQDALQILKSMAFKQASMMQLSSGPIITPPPVGKSGVMAIPKDYPQYPAPPTPNRMLPGKGQTSTTQNPPIKLPPPGKRNKIDYTGR